MGRIRMTCQRQVQRSASQPGATARSPARTDPRQTPPWTCRRPKVRWRCRRWSPRRSAWSPRPRLLRPRYRDRGSVDIPARRRLRRGAPSARRRAWPGSFRPFLLTKTPSGSSTQPRHTPVLASSQPIECNSRVSSTVRSDVLTAGPPRLQAGPAWCAPGASPVYPAGCTPPPSHPSSPPGGSLAGRPRRLPLGRPRP